MAATEFKTPANRLIAKPRGRWHLPGAPESQERNCALVASIRWKLQKRGGKEMHFSRLLLIVAAALPLGACFTTAEQIAANDDAACRSAGLKPGTPAYVQCLDDNRRMRLSQEAAMQQQMWAMEQSNRQLMQMNTQTMMRR
ncbi:MAG TPA: hypothetical protein VK635_30195 [Bradyrhizobium sp.]|nr:hypothetical protein [Bradyrhizobium sp.]